MSTLASALINEVRDILPDPVYDVNGVAQPGTDGNLFRSQTLLRMMDRATKDTARKIGWVVEDWYAFQQVANQPDYALDGKWLNLTLPAFANQRELGFLPEKYLLYPARASGSNPTNWSLHRFTDHLDVVLFPTPSTTDASTTLVGALSASATTLTLTSATGFLTFGYLLIGTEIIRYDALAGAVASPLTRGACGTTAVAHSNLDPVTLLGAWIKGKRLPLDITATTSVVEVPSMAIQAVEYRMLELCARAQNDPGGEGASYAKSFKEECDDILNDPTWKQNPQVQLPAYGMPAVGELAWGTTVLP